MWLFNAAIFLSAFLLFQVELIIAKILLPIYGGSYLVWGACMVFFQAVLLGGYLFSHLVLTRLGLRRYRIAHLVLVFLPFLFFPGRAISTFPPHQGWPVVFDIFLQLLSSIGPAFFVLSTMSLVLQAWLAQSDLKDRSNPYFLYSISNLGSLLGLLTYPLVFEIWTDLEWQENFWRLGFALLVFLQTLIFFRIRVQEKAPEAAAEKSSVQGLDILRWLLLGSGGVVLFLSVTNIFTTEIAPIPLLWILPLSIYLLSYILNFKKVPWCPSWIREQISLILGFSVLLFFLTSQATLPFILEVVLFCLFLFLLCMYCQNDLYRHRPANRKDLTLFYVTISVGGFLGGIFVSWVIPVVSISQIEYFVGLLLVSSTLLVGQGNPRVKASSVRLVFYFLFLLSVWPFKFIEYNIYGFVFLVIAIKIIYSELKKSPAALNLSLALLIVLTPVIEKFWSNGWNNLYEYRNYYGTYKIFRLAGTKFLMHGTTIHGAQYINEDRERVPLTYYFVTNPIGQFFMKGGFPLSKIGVVGLGVGTVTTFTKSGQELDYFELDPDVFPIASQYFSFLKNAKSKVNIIYGDARMALAKIPDQTYDLLIIDAFGGDAIPVHLVTVEGIGQYRRVLKPGGIVIFNISNRYLDLSPVLTANAREVGALAGGKDDYDVDSRLVHNHFGSQWFFMTWDQEVYDRFIKDLNWQPRRPDPANPVKVWTDRYYNIFSIISRDKFFNELQNFRPFEFRKDLKELLAQKEE